MVIYLGVIQPGDAGHDLRSTHVHHRHGGGQPTQPRNVNNMQIRAVIVLIVEKNMILKHILNFACVTILLLLYFIACVVQVIRIVFCQPISDNKLCRFITIELPLTQEMVF